MRRFITSISLILSLFAPVAAEQFFAFQGLLNTPWQSAQLWDGGLNSHQNWVLNTGVNILAPDGGGVYLQKSSDLVWHQLMTDVGLAPAACDSTTGFTNPGSCFGVYPTTGTTQAITYWAGAIDICGSPANAGTLFVFWNGYILKSTNVNINNPEATTFINVNQSPINSNWVKTIDNSNLANRVHGPFLACDPNNKDHLLVASQGTASITPTVKETKDGGSTFAAISSSDVPASIFTGNGIVYIPVFDPGSGTTGGITSTVCIFTNGAPLGVYCSLTGGGTGTWLRIGTGGPTTVDHMEFNPTTHTLWVVDTLGALWNCAGSPLTSCTWTSTLASSDNISWFSVNPLNNTQMIALDINGNLWTNSTSGTGSWVIRNPTTSDGDQAWYVNTIAASGSGYNVAFSPINNGVINANLGQGAFTTTAFPTGAFVWTAQTKGIMHQAANAIVSTSAFNVATGSQDISMCTVNLFSIPTKICSPMTLFSGLKYASGMAVSTSDPTYSVSKISANFSAFDDSSGWSHDGFKSDYHRWNRWEVTVLANLITDNGSGIVRVTVPSTSGLTEWVNGQGTMLCSNATVRTTGTNVLSNGNTPMTSCYPVHIVSSTQFDLVGAGFGSPIPNFNPLNTIVSQINGSLGSYVFFDGTWPGSNLSEARNITAVQSDGGKIQVCVFNIAGAFSAGMPIDISGVIDAGGVSTANGRWIINNPSTGTIAGTRCFDLGPTSTFSGNAYVSGGTGKTFIEPGGSIATSGTNVVVMPGNNGYPVCSTDLGTSIAGWNTVTNSSVPGVLTTLTGGPYSAGSTRFTVVDGTKVPDLATINIPMDDGRLLYGIVEGGLSIAASGSTYDNTTGNVVLILSVDTTAITGDSVIISGLKGTGAANNQAIASLVWSAGVVTATTTVPHGFTIGPTIPVTIAGATPTAYNGLVNATITGASTFTYPIVSNPGTETVPGTVNALNGTYTTTAISSDGLTISFTAAAGLGVSTITGGTFNLTGNVFGLARVGFSSPVVHYTVPPLRSLANGANIYNVAKGWVTADFLDSHTVTADTVTPNTFYMANWIYGGLIKWVGCGATLRVNPIVRPSGWQFQGGNNATLAAAPGEAGHLYYTDGNVGAPPAISSTKLQRACNGTNNIQGDGITTGVIFQGIKGTFAPRIIGFGKNKPGKSYASIVYIGWYDPTGLNIEANGKYGIWRSIDDPNHGNTGDNVSCKDNSAQFTGTITGTTLTFPSVTGTVSIDDGILAPVGGDVVAGTKIVSGSGLSWQVNISQNVGPEAMSAGGTFQSIGDFPSAFPGGPKWNSSVSSITCDLFVYGPCYLQTLEGPFYGVFNYLLKRDLDPAANDNSPVFLNIAA